MFSLGLVVLLLALLILTPVDAQRLRTSNGSLIFEVGAASLTFNSGTTNNCNNANSNLVYQSDLQTSISNSIGQLQPQVANGSLTPSLLSFVQPRPHTYQNFHFTDSIPDQWSRRQCQRYKCGTNFSNGCREWFAT